MKQATDDRPRPRRGSHLPGVTPRAMRPGQAAMVTLVDLAVTAANPVPWARAQMAFTLAFHIILVPLGVSWAFMTLIANYRGVRHHDADALRLAHRWSTYMAVTFAVGAVTGTVLSFEFGLLWPQFMGQWGEAFGVPFAF
jgi:cytochrome bd ubiquinol oxidase subunit I